MRFKYLLNFSPDWFDYSKRRVNKAYEKALHGLGVMWYREILPKHFTNAAMREYGYQPRTVAYARYKAKKERRTEPLIGVTRKGHQAGTLMRMALGGGKIRATPKRLRVDFEVPAYGKSRGRKGTGPDKVRELTEISDGERTFFVKKFLDDVKADLESQPKRRPKEI